MRPSFSLALIAKNEAPNVKRLFDSVEGVFDEIVFVDTGSTDGTQDIAKSLGANVYHFDWVNDFAAARNYSFDQVKTDYVAWLDLDDVLHNKQGLIDFRDNAMKYFDYVFATYNYALDDKGNPIISFMRERVLNMRRNPRWNYFVHEGVKPPEGSRVHYCTSWAVDHLRSVEDMKKDKSRNLKIFEEKMKSNQLDGRMVFYYGKELYENQQAEKALPILLDAFQKYPLEMHDRILCLQYAIFSCMFLANSSQGEERAKKLQLAIHLCSQGEVLAPRRAEFFATKGDCYQMLGLIHDAIPMYAAAKNCFGVQMAGDKFASQIHALSPLYNEYPRNQLGRLYANIGELELSKKELTECIQKYHSEDAYKALEELKSLQVLSDPNTPKTKTEDIVFTCPPQTAYTFDEELYKTKGMGGSETALIEVAKYLKKTTGLPVKVFNMRDSTLVSESGVEWISAKHTLDYFSRYEPKIHIAWRHNNKVTKAKSFLWCHDLMIPGVEMGLNQDFVLALTPFHRDFLISSQGVPKEKIILTKNGISPEKFKGLDLSKKDPLKFVYSSSPDRGLDRAILILDKVRAKGYDIKLHVFYGRENLRKFGLAPLADQLDKMIIQRNWIIDHGFTEQRKMYEHYAEACYSLLPNNFIETSCITVKELLACGVYPIIRRWGGVQDTLAEAEKLGMCKMLEIDSETDLQHEEYAKAVIEAIESKAYEKVSLNPEEHSWQNVAFDWIKMFDIVPETPKQPALDHKEPLLEL